MHLSQNNSAVAFEAKPKWLKTIEPPSQKSLSNGLFKLYGENSYGRIKMERFIHKQFARYYGANVTEFLPLLLTLESSGVIRSGLGVRLGGLKPLFLEQYLHNPIQVEARKVHGLTVHRNALVEIGNLACARRGLCQLMFIALTIYLERNSIDWVACNATRLVQNNFTRLGFQCFPLCVADKHKLKNGFKQWGSYYDTESEVTLVNVHQAYQCLTSNSSLFARLESIEASTNKLPDLKLLV